MPQHTPLTVTVEPPFEVILPPDVAEVRVIPVAAVVLKIGITATV